MPVVKLRRWRRLRQLRRHRIAFAPWHELMRAEVFHGLTAVERARLRALATLFLQRKSFNGAHDLVVTPDMMLAIAAQACLPILDLGIESLDGWIEIVLYPGAFRVAREHVEAGGIVSRREQVLTGEAWQRGPLILSWDDVATDLFDAEPGYNVVLHECAHKLDMLDGSSNGLPPLHAGMSRQRWADVFGAAFARLQRQVTIGGNVINGYAASAPEEFFAVTSEYFFTAPQVLREEFSAVYEQLAMFYRQDPARRRVQAVTG